MRAKCQLNVISAVFLLSLVFSSSLFSQTGDSFQMTDFTAESSELAAVLSRSGRGLNSTVIDTVKIIPRHRFLDVAYKSIAYNDIAVPGFDGSIVPSPGDLVTAVSLLSPDSGDNILVAGNNAGYAAALLSQLCSKVYLIEETSGASVYRDLFTELGIDNIVIAKNADMREFDEILAFDKIFIHAAESELSERVTERLAIQGNITFILSIEGSFQQLVSLRRSLLGDSIISAGSCYFPENRTLKIGN
jgi:protein-L-isoaspartate(D-aspartate) O-methyltransferase